MKVALIDPSLFTWPYDHALAEGLHVNSHDVTLYTRHLAAREQGKGDPFICEFFYPGFEKPPIKSLPRPVFLALKGIAHILCMAALWLKLRNEKPDVIHFQWAPLAIVDKAFIPLFRKLAPVVLTVHDSSPFNNNPSAALQRVGAIDIMGRFDHLIVHTDKARQALLGYGLPASSVSRIDHGILDHMGEAQSQTAKSAEDPVVLLLFGQVKPYKGTDILLNALALLPDASKKKCRLRVVGKPQMDMGPLFALVEQHNLQSCVEWDLRFVDENEIPDLFAASDIMVMPYREIDASGVLMLALAVGRPIVASRIGLFAEILQDGVHGYLVNQEDPQSLANALDRLVQNRDLRSELGQNVASLRKSIPSWKEIGETTASLYRTLILRA